jgi:hypothetical protein
MSRAAFSENCKPELNIVAQNRPTQRKKMKNFRLTIRPFILLTVLTITAFAGSGAAQTCSPNPTRIHFIDGGSTVDTPVMSVYPGHGYTLVLQGTDVDLLRPGQVWFLKSSASLSSTKTDSRWSVEFVAGTDGTIGSIQLLIKCTRNPNTFYQLDRTITLHKSPA